MTQNKFENCTLDQTGRVSQVSTTLNGNPKTLASNITYLPFGGITGLTYGNGLTLTQGYDNQYRISSIAAGSILNLTFGYDPNGNIISVLDVVNPPGGEVLEAPGTYSYQQATNKLTHIDGTPIFDFGYDANGNIISANNRAFIYDLSNQLVRVEDNGTTIAQYVYNGIGQRTKKNAQGSVRIFLYNHLGYLISETTDTGQILVEYVYLGNKLLALIQGEQVYYFHNDHLGTPQVLTDDSGSIAWKATYTPFGKAQVVIETVTNPFRLPGQFYDGETGLHYNYFRYYNPQTGRYITPDPIGLEGGINLFAYVDANPLRWIDPFGLVTWPTGDRVIRGWFREPRKKGPHMGLDIRARMGKPVYASDSGTVIGVWFDKDSGGGYSILILGDDGSIYGYAHTGQLVVEGQRVEEGQVIGFSDGSGGVIPHLHYTYKPPCSG
jgi:RHS repeat-associated protein